MAYSFSVNLTPANGAESIWNLIDKLMNVGWEKIKDADGSTYSSSGTQVTSPGSGANGLANTKAWIVLRDPSGAGGRQLCFHNSDSSSYYWRIKYSPSAGFSGGSPSAIQTPTATDEQVIFGSGTDANPDNTQLFYTDGLYKQYIVVDSSAKYGFICVFHLNGTGVPRTVIMMDPLISNTYPSEDVDPVVLYAFYGNGSVLTYSVLNDTTNGPKCYLKKGLAGEGFVTVGASSLTAQGGTIAPGGSGINPHNSKDDTYPIIWARQSAQTSPAGYKGVSSLLKWNGLPRTVGSTLSSKARVIFSDVSMPFDGASTINI